MAGLPPASPVPRSRGLELVAERLPRELSHHAASAWLQLHPPGAPEHPVRGRQLLWQQREDCLFSLANNGQGSQGFTQVASCLAVEQKSSCY